MNLQPHQARVVDERTALAEKIFKLNEFIRGVTFTGLDRAEQKRLERQSIVMQEYAAILAERINAF